MSSKTADRSTRGGKVQASIISPPIVIIRTIEAMVEGLRRAERDGVFGERVEAQPVPEPSLALWRRVVACGRPRLVRVRCDEERPAVLRRRADDVDAAARPRLPPLCVRGDEVGPDEVDSVGLWEGRAMKPEPARWQSRRGSLRT